MKVILIKSVSGLGKEGEVKEVADGYALNFLFPKNLGVSLNTQIIKDKEAQDKKKAKDETKDLQRQQKLAEKLDGMLLELKAKANDTGKLYASIMPKDIMLELKKKKIVIDLNQVKMEPIKQQGDFGVLIKLRHGLEANINVIVSN